MRINLSALFILFSIPGFSAENCSKQQATIIVDDFKVELSSYLLSKSSRHILIIPPTGGSNYLDRSWAKNFCSAGFNAHILEHWTEDDEYAIDLGIHQRFYSRAQRAIELSLDHIKGASFVGIMGTSIGGVHTAMAMGIHDRLNAAFVITAGADMPSIIANSDQDVMIEAWNKRKVKFGIPDKETYIKMLNEQIVYEPLKLPRKFEGKDLGMIISSGDTTVPYANQVKLKDHWKPKVVLNYSQNHFWTIVMSWLWDSKKIIVFFQKSAEKETTR